MWYFVVVAVFALSHNCYSDLKSNDGVTDQTSGLYFGDEIPGLEKDTILEFRKGYLLFVKLWNVKETASQSFNASSCVACHNVPMVGGSGIGLNTFVAIDPRTGEVFRKFLIGPDDVTIQRAPPKNFILRKAPSLLGLGLLENVPIWELTKFADPYDTDGNGISGRLVQRGRSFGRFGWKGTINNIEQFVSVALSNELGVRINIHGQNSVGSTGIGKFVVSATNEEIKLISQYIRLLGVPPRGNPGPLARIGERVFNNIGCGHCHRSTLKTGISDIPVLNQRIIHPYTDLLLHDMGPGMSDSISQSGVSSSEFRTAPLWGISSSGPPYLHDGRALNINEAIENHGGEADPARSKYMELTPRQRLSLLQFINSL